MMMCSRGAYLMVRKLKDEILQDGELQARTLQDGKLQARTLQERRLQSQGVI